MSFPVIIAAILVISFLGYYFGMRRALTLRASTPLHSLPNYHGLYVALKALLPSVVLVLLWIIFQPSYLTHYIKTELVTVLGAVDENTLELYRAEIVNISTGSFGLEPSNPAFLPIVEGYKSLQQSSIYLCAGLACLLAISMLFFTYRTLQPRLRTRNRVEHIIKVIMILASTVAIITTIGIVFSLLFETIRFFGKVPINEFLFGLKWSPQTALREGQVGSSGAFGAIPLIAGTLLITFIAMCVAVPIGLMSAIYMSEYATPNVRKIAKPIIEILAGIPTVVYGFFAALTVAPLFRNVGESVGLTVASESALAAGVVMGVMIIPFVSSLSDDVINAVPQTLRDGASALGATKSETVRQVILPAALPGIVGAILLAISRAIGETMIVVMAAGLAANLTVNPLEAVTTVTVQMVTLLVGDQEFDSAKTLAAFALGLLLFIVTLILNVIALKVVQKYREQYD